MWNELAISDQILQQSCSPERDHCRWLKLTLLSAASASQPKIKWALYIHELSLCRSHSPKPGTGDADMQGNHCESLPWRRTCGTPQSVTSSYFALAAHHFLPALTSHRFNPLDRSTFNACISAPRRIEVLWVMTTLLSKVRIQTWGESLLKRRRTQNHTVSWWGEVKKCNLFMQVEENTIC